MEDSPHTALRAPVPKRRGAHIGWTDDSRGGGLRIDNEADGGAEGRGVRHRDEKSGEHDREDGFLT